MAKLINGKDVLTFFREHDKQTSDDGTRLRFQAEVSLSEESSTNSRVTTDGAFNTITSGENTADFSSIAYEDDGDTLEIWRALKNFRRNNVYLEMWIIYNTGETQQAEYMTGYITSFELSAPADGEVELSYSFAIDGDPIEGEETLTPEQLGLISGGDKEYKSVIGSNNAESV